MGSEMCIRDSTISAPILMRFGQKVRNTILNIVGEIQLPAPFLKVTFGFDLSIFNENQQTDTLYFAIFAPISTRFGVEVAFIKVSIVGKIQTPASL